LLCWVGYIVAFTKVLRIYQLYHTWIHPFHHSPLFSSPLIPEILSTGIFFQLHTCVHSICTIFTLLHPFPTSSSLLLVPNTPSMTWFCKRKKKMTFLLVATQGFSLCTSMYLYMIV
jgi:hypothetical protein